jgi:Ca-activated chloride channel family protein
MKLHVPVSATLILAFQPLFAQVTISTSTQVHLPASQIIVPQTRVFASSVAGPGHVEVSEVNIRVAIVEQVATTTMDLSLSNTSDRRLEAQMLVPVPEGAVLRGFMFQGHGAEPTAELLVREEARRIYDEIVSRVRDPALLEFLGCNLVRSSVFPVEPRAGQRIRIVYEQLLPCDGDRIDFVLPRTESVDYRVPWRISVKISSKSPIATVYSPSHRIETARHGEGSVFACVTPDAITEPGPFRLSCLRQRSDMTASLLAYPDARVGGGYFLLLAGAPSLPVNAEPMKREVILVLDRSGSMAGEKLEQVRAAALQVLEGLDEGEGFNLIAYNEAVEVFAPEPMLKNAESMRSARAYLGRLRVRGGTNLHDALEEALRMKATPGFLPLVLFLTDGLPTVGQTSEKAIREIAAKGNPHDRRVFAFGVGVDVNTPLLDRIAIETRATSTYVLPREDVEVKVGQVFDRLSGPVLSEPALRARDKPTTSGLGRVRDLLPSRLPDIFAGDQIIVLGQYVGKEPLSFELRGTCGGHERTFNFQFDLDRATTKNAFVPRLWASRKIAILTDAIRDLGADYGVDLEVSAADPRMKELVDEIVRLSKEFGILTEYTAFLAREGTDLWSNAALFREAYGNFDERARKVRSGWGSVNQSFNNSLQRGQIAGNRLNKFYDSTLNVVEITTVQQVNDRAFYKRGNRWVDSTLLDDTNPAGPRVVEVGSDAFRRLFERLAAENRQGVVALKGEILLRVGGENVLVR